MSGIKGRLCKPKNFKSATLQAKFSERIRESDLVMCKFWTKVEPPKFYIPLLDLEGRGEQMKAIAELQDGQSALQSLLVTNKTNTPSGINTKRDLAKKTKLKTLLGRSRTRIRVRNDRVFGFPNLQKSVLWDQDSLLGLEEEKSSQH